MSATGFPVPAPGSFAAILKQSKFATYHPSIAQVYTVFGGHAQRGDWGLKRALPERKRHRRLKISAIDTREQQSWFDSGETNARTVARWDEIGTRVNVAYDKGRWREQGFTKLSARAIPNIDSEFGGFAVPKTGPVDPALGLRYDFNSKVFPNIYKMNDSGFDKYLKKVEGRRSEFRAHVQGVEDHQRFAKRGPVSLYYFRNKSHESFGRTGNDFLELLAEDEITKEGSRILQAVPHPNGGLSYTSPSYLQTRLTTPPIKSHVIHAHRSTAIAVIGSVTAQVTPGWRSHNKEILEVDYRRSDPQRGTYNMRVLDAYMQDPPQVVGRRYFGGIGSMSMEVSVHPVDSDAMDHERANPYPPGSVLYCFSDSGRATSVRRVQSQPPKPYVSMSNPARQKKTAVIKAALERMLSGPLKDKP